MRMASNHESLCLPSPTSEFDSIQLHDGRLERRSHRIVERLSVDPARSIPQVMVSVADTEATYRFLSNKRVAAKDIYAPHLHNTWRRASAAREVLSIEDTTEMRFGGLTKRDGLGKLMNDGQGFYLHGALLVALNGVPEIGRAHV